MREIRAALPAEDSTPGNIQPCFQQNFSAINITIQNREMKNISIEDISQYLLFENMSQKEMYVQLSRARDLGTT